MPNIAKAAYNGVMMLVDLVITSMIIHYLVKMNNTSDDLIKATCPKISSCNDFNVPVFLFVHILTFLLLLIFNFPYFIMKIYRLSAVIRYMHVM